MDEEYQIRDTSVGRTTKEKGLGVTVSAEIKASEQYGIATNKHAATALRRYY